MMPAICPIRTVTTKVKYIAWETLNGKARYVYVNTRSPFSPWMLEHL